MRFTEEVLAEARRLTAKANPADAGHIYAHILRAICIEWQRQGRVTLIG